jgi:16S rRNA (uracil1498-N3)-methyltransferase
LHLICIQFEPVSQLQRVAVSPSQIHHPAIHLTADQIHYLQRVLRLAAGDRFIAMDGQGHWWLTQLGDEPGQGQILDAIAADTELPVPVTLVAALPKGSGFEEVVRQVTELGVTTIMPVISDRTLLKPSSNKLNRWRRIAQEAAEQSERLVIPTLLDPVPVSAYWDDAHADEKAVSYLCTARRQSCLLGTHLARSQFPPSAVTVAIGPEGGWTEAEVDRAIAAGYQPVSLGRRILRAVTAPTVALSMIALQLEQMSVQDTV